MKRFMSKWKTVVVAAALAVTVMIPGVAAEAKTISKKETLDKTISYVGNELEFYGKDIKINGKKTSKFKKKVKVKKTDTNPTAFSYHTKSYFKNSNVYSQWDDYNNATYNAIKYVAKNHYSVKFLKAGTYNISYVDYSKEDIDDSDWTYNVNGKYGYYQKFTKDGVEGTEWFEEKKTNSGETYYQGISSKKIYAYSYVEDSYVEASIKTGADKLQHVYCSPRNVIKTTYTRQYKVLATSKVVSSVKLGKTTVKNANKYGAYSSSSSSQRSFLSGSKGKLTVKMADKNYSITSIVLLTYDKDGNAVYTKVNNKKTVTYGANKSSYKTSYSSYSSMYKPTTVIVNYKNKFTGAFSQIEKIEKDAYGRYVFTVRYRNAGDTKDTVTQYYDDCDTSYQQCFTFYKK